MKQLVYSFAELLTALFQESTNALTSDETYIQSHYVSTDVCVALECIQGLVGKLVIQYRSCLLVYKSLAIYILLSHDQGGIKEDLKQGSIRKLKRFVDDSQNYVKDCRRCMDDCDCTEYDEITRHLDSIMTELSKKVEEKAKSIRKNTIISRAATVGTTITAACSVVAAIAVPFVTLPAVGIAFSVMGGGGILLSGGVGSVAAGFNFARHLHVNDQKVLIKIFTSAKKIQEELNKHKKYCAGFEQQLKTVTSIIEGSATSDCKGLKYLAEHPERNDDGELESFIDITVKLDSLKDRMKYMLSIIESEFASDKLKD